jgi:hypothetical protein
MLGTVAVTTRDRLAGLAAGARVGPASFVGSALHAEPYLELGCPSCPERKNGCPFLIQLPANGNRPCRCVYDCGGSEITCDPYAPCTSGDACSPC